MTNTTPKNIPMPTYPQYKDIGIPWLRKIPAHWEVVRFKFLFKERNERSITGNEDLLSVSQYTGVTIKKHRITEKELLTNANSLEGYKIVKKKDLVSNIMLAWNGSLGFSKYDGITSPAYSVYKLNEGNDSDFFHYLVRSETYKSEFKRKSSGIIESRLRLYTEDFFNIYSILPPKSEQTAIAHFLDRKTTQIDQAIAQKQALIDRLKTYKQVLIQQAVTKGLNPDAPLKDSGVEWIGQIPAHWEVRKLRSLLNEIVEKNHPNLPLLSITRDQGVIIRNVSDLETNHNFIPDDLSNYKLIEKNQFGINKMKSWQGSFGVSKFKGIISPAYYVYEINSILEPEFFNFAIRSKVYISFFYAASDGVRIGQWDLSKDRMKNIPFIVPPKKEQAEIVKYIEAKTTQIDRSIALQEAEIQRLQTYKTVLIDQAVTGKIKLI